VHIAVDRKVCGAGIMLDGEYVLTCAHVVVSGSADLSSQPAAGIRIHFDGRDDLEPQDAEIVPSQVMTMIVRSGDLGFGLWPLTVALSTFLSAPFVAAAFVGSRLRPASSITSSPTQR